jgi:ATP-dependent Lhr-like helicase
MGDVLERFSPATRSWFTGAFPEPTTAQVGAWEAISSGAHALVVAPTGSGKTLAAFLWSIDRLITQHASPGAAALAAGGSGAASSAKSGSASASASASAKEAARDAERTRTRVLYISPLKALGVDVERNLRSPLVGITQTAKRLGLPAPGITVGVRSGDTSTQDRRLLARTPPDILITTPESLYLMLTSAARETLLGVETVIVDEIHAVASTKRGAHLAVSLERLDALLPKPAQRIGLSATVRPREEVARFLGGSAPVTIVAPPSGKRFDLKVVVPVDDMTELGTAPVMEGSSAGTAPQGSIWPHVEERIVDLILEHRSTIVFANSRRLAERLTARLNEIFIERMSPDGGFTPAADVPDGGFGTAELAPDRGFGAAELTPDGGFGSAEFTPAVEERVLETVAATSTTHQAGTGMPAQMMAQSGTTTGASPLLARAHHGSVSKDQRALIEDDLKTGRLRCVVATSSLELGIDMGEVDLVVQVESPPSVASGLQRVGRAGHQVGEISRGVLFPKHRADLIHTAVVSERMVSGEIEAIAIPTNPLDILAQHTIAAVALEPLDIEEWYESLRRSAPFATLPRSAYEATLDLLSGLYPSDEFAELRPRIVWDRVSGTLTGRPGAQRLAVTSGGTIPDRGLFGVFMVGASSSSGSGSGGGGRVGELDEEMVYESRVGDVFALGATSWRIEDITHDRVMVTPAYGQPGRVPFWKGDGLGRPAELGQAIGQYIREVSSASTENAAVRVAGGGLDERAVTNLIAFIAEQKVATGHVPTDTTLVVERFRDELGDWRLILHSPYGMPVHSPWALAITARVRERFGYDGAAVAGDDGIIVRLPDTESEPPGAELFVFEAADLEQIVTEEVGGSALFAARFRECAARALLLPRYNPGKRSPLWQQRQRASQLLEVARKYPSFPIVLETVREVLQDVYDLPALMALTARIANRSIRIVETETDSASPFARSLLFGYVAAFMYEGDSPLAERRAAALSLDPTLLAELLGRAELRELLDPGVIEQTELELQRLAPDRRVRDLEGVVDLLRVVGPLSVDEIVQRSWLAGEANQKTKTDDDADADAAADPSPAASGRDALLQGLTDLARSNRVLRATIAGEERWAVIEDASRLRDALGVPLPIGVPAAFVEPVSDPVGDLVSRYARTHSPFTASVVAARFGLGVAVVLDSLRRLGQGRRVVEGEFRPGATGSEWVDAEILRRLRSRSLAALRHEVEPVSQDTLGRFLPAWQNVGTSKNLPRLSGVDGLVQVIDQLGGVALPASAWESLILPARLRNYTPAWLDELTVTGEVFWSGAGSLAGSDGWVSLHLADTAQVTLAAAPTDDALETTELQREILVSMAGGGAYFFRQLASAVGSTDDAELTTAIWDLVWAGLITNDTFSPLRSFLGGKAAPSRAPRTRAYRGRARPSLPTQAGPPSVGGRWSLLPLAEGDTTVRAKATAELLLERHGVVTRGAVMSEGIRGGFSLMYKVLSTFEETGRARRGYFVDGLGGAQFATGATVDRLRHFTRDPGAFEQDRETDDDPVAVTLAATDPANPYGAALPWPQVTGHRPGRKAGALVVIVDGFVTLYVERGGKTVLTFSEDERVLAAAASSLAATVRHGLGKLRIELVDGEFSIGTPLGAALMASGFAATPQGLRLRM